MLFEKRKGRPISPLRQFKEEDEIFSFLICNKLNFDVEEIDFEEIYKNIPHLKYRHNVILSLQDGLITYKLTFSNLPLKQKQAFLIKGGEINTNPVIWNFPHHSELKECYKCDIQFQKIDSKDKYDHIKSFLMIIKSLLRDIYEYEFDLVEYLEPDTVKIFKKHDKKGDHVPE